MDASPARHAWAWRELARTLDWLRVPNGRDVESAFQKAQELLPDEPRFAEELSRFRRRWHRRTSRRNGRAGCWPKPIVVPQSARHCNRKNYNFPYTARFIEVMWLLALKLRPQFSSLSSFTTACSFFHRGRPPTRSEQRLLGRLFFWAVACSRLGCKWQWTLSGSSSSAPERRRA